MPVKRLRVGDHVVLSASVFRVYPSMRLSMRGRMGTVVGVSLLIRPDYYGYLVKFVGRAKPVLLGQDALRVVR